MEMENRIRNRIAKSLEGNIGVININLKSNEMAGIYEDDRLIGYATGEIRCRIKYNKRECELRIEKVTL